MNPRDARGILRWYPAAWRRRYGEELIAMLDDTYGNDKLPRRVRMSLLRSGLIERIRLLRKYSSTYVGYSIACAVVWAVILATVWTQRRRCHPAHVCGVLRRVGDRLAVGEHRTRRLPATETTQTG